MAEEGGGLSRRALLQKAAVAGGIVWVAPVVMTVEARGLTAGSPAPSTTTTTATTVRQGECGEANSFKSCGDPITPCGPTGACVCVQTTEGDFACVTDVDDACANPGPPLCTSSDQCPPSEPICLTVDNCCGDGFGRCIQPCKPTSRKYHKDPGLTLLA